MGRLQIRNGLAGVIFDSELIDKTLGQTAKALQYDLFGASNLMNAKLFDPDASKPANASKRPPLPHDPKRATLNKLDIGAVQQGQNQSDKQSIVSELKAARMKQSDKENVLARAKSGYMVPSVSNSFGKGSLEKMLDGMGDSSLRKLV